MKRKHRHLSARLVTRLDDGAASPEVLGRVLAHAGEACDDCAAVLADYGAVGSLGRARFGYRRAGRRAARRAFAASRECQLAEGLLTELFALASWERLVAALGSNPRFQTWGVASRLIDSAVAALETNAEEAAAMATLALVVAEALDERYPRSVVADTRAMASVQLAKARLALGDLAAAHQALASAETLRRRGSGARFFRAEVALLAFFDFPAEHWVHLRTTNPIESAFSTVRLRQRVTKGAGNRLRGLAMAFKLLEMAQLRWRRLNAGHLLPLVRAGACFEDGVFVERTDTVTQKDQAA